jgi:hypothetical protein
MQFLSWPIGLALFISAVAPVMAIEQPRFDLVSRDGELDIRRYPPLPGGRNLRRD